MPKQPFSVATALLLLSSSAGAWVPQLDEVSAKQVIDAAYGRIDPIQTFASVDFTVKDGKFANASSLKAFSGGDVCLSTWLADPKNVSTGSRPTGLTVIGQADQLFFQATEARDNFKNLTAKEALSEQYAGTRQAAGELRIDMNVQGLPTQRARDAYVVRLRAPNGKLISPYRRSFVDNFKQEGTGWKGTLVYYFKPLEEGVLPTDKVDLLFRTEADTDCAYSVTLDLGSFQ